MPEDSSKKKSGLKDSSLFNLSTAVISSEEKNVLNHGLKFVPPRLLNKFETFIDSQKFLCKMNIKRYLVTSPLRLRTGGPSEIKKYFSG